MGVGCGVGSVLGAGVVELSSRCFSVSFRPFFFSSDTREF